MHKNIEKAIEKVTSKDPFKQFCKAEECYPGTVKVWFKKLDGLDVKHYDILVEIADKNTKHPEILFIHEDISSLQIIVNMKLKHGYECDGDPSLDEGYALQRMRRIKTVRLDNGV